MAKMIFLDNLHRDNISFLEIGREEKQEKERKEIQVTLQGH